MKLITKLILIGLLISSIGLAELALVVNKDNDATVLTREILKKSYLTGAGKWTSKESIEVIIPDKGAVRDEFFASVLNMSENDYKKFRMARTYQGKDVPANIETGITEIAGIAAKNINIVGVIGADQAAEAKGKVKTITLSIE